MKRNVLLIATLFMLSLLASAQPNGGLHMGFFGAFPQNELKDAKYDNGYGFQMGLYTKPFSMGNLNSPLSFQLGMRMDFADMKDKEFNVILSTPVPDNGALLVQNTMYGFFGVVRMSYAPGRVMPYADFLVGHRNYHTKQSISALNPDLNPDYESTSYSNKVVWTKKPHIGFGAGLMYKINDNLNLDLGATYTMGNQGFVMPLQDVVQEENEVFYNYKTVNTDILLIKASLIIRLKRERTYNPNPESTPNPTSGSTRTRTPTRTGSGTSTRSSGSSSGSSGGGKTLEPATNGSGSGGGGVNH